jgi:hypothetical protein
MRYINIDEVMNAIPQNIKTDLQKKNEEASNGDDQTKRKIIRNGNLTWRQIKNCLNDASNRKCWYTESKNPGCHNDVDHFRPKAKKLKKNGEIDYWYWFLAFDPENYRLSCQFSNRLNTNPKTGFKGGKSNQFPLINEQPHARTKEDIAQENPVLLDPCNSNDCDLLEFQPDGRPVVSLKHSDNQVTCYRIEQSKLLLNLDFPTFNEDREALYNNIKKLVERGDNYNITHNSALGDVKDDLRELMQEDSPYSKAAECYIRCFRDREWIEELLFH